MKEVLGAGQYKSKMASGKLKKKMPKKQLDQAYSGDHMETPTREPIPQY